MTAGSGFELGSVTKTASDIASMNQLMRIWDAEREVVQSRTWSVGEYDVVRISFPLQEGKNQIIRAIECDIFGQAETHSCVKFAGASNIRRNDLEMIEPQGMGALEVLELGDQARLGRHGRANLQRRADGIG